MKKLRVLTMTGGLDLVGELAQPDYDTSLTVKLVRLEYPCLIQRQSPANLVLTDLLKTGVLDGTSIEINLGAVLWIGTPAKQLASAYQSQRAGLLMPGPAAVRANG